MSATTYGVMFPPEQAERLTDWPSRCIVCLREHGLLHESKSAKQAVKHRRKKHAWLHEALVREGLAPA